MTSELEFRQPSLYYLKPERSISSDIRQDLAGIVKLRIGVLYEPELRNEIFTSWDKTFKKPDFNPGILISNVYHCKDLIPSDNEGTSDPFIIVSYFGNEGASNIIEQTLNPVWNETFDLYVNEHGNTTTTNTTKTRTTTTANNNNNTPEPL